MTATADARATDASLSGRPARAAGRRRRPQLRASCRRIEDVAAADRDAAWALFDAAYVGAERNRFHSDWDDKQWVILLRDPATGDLQGFSTVAITEVCDALLPGGRATVVFSGDTVVAPAYWGSKSLQRGFSRLMIRTKLRRPTRPLYWFLISKGYKTYLMLVRACPHAVPRCDRADDVRLRRVRDVVARQRFGADYDRAAGIVRHGARLEAVRPGLCPVDASLLSDPHVAFFVARNPGHVDGDELACVADMRLRDPLRQLLRVLRRPRADARRVQAPVDAPVAAGAGR